MKTENTPQDAKQRKFLVFLPIAAIPFITLIFWSLGGGKAAAPVTAQQTKASMNMELPDASFEKNKPQDKMSFYKQAVLDSIKKSELARHDPYYNSGGGPSGPAMPGQVASGLGYQQPYATPGLNNSVYGNQQYGSANEAQVYARLNQLNSVINQPAAAVPSALTPTRSPAAGLGSSDIDRLEKMMNTMQQGDGQADPEMQQINTMLERILDIQHPERAQEKISTAKDAKRGQIYAVSSQVEENPVTIISKPARGSAKAAGGFFGIDEAATQQDDNAIEAVVHDNQTIVTGSIVKLRLTSDVMINGELIPKDNFIFGEASISGERLKIEIASIRYNNSIYPVKLSVFDLDGMDGIHIPGAISRDVAKESGTDVMEGLGMNSFDPSLATQAASAGIEMSKSLIKKKVKLVKVTLKAGYKLLLKDEKQ
jgi:conjugative transposon TraM protein